MIEFGAKYLKYQIYWIVHMGPISVPIYNTTFSNYFIQNEVIFIFSKDVTGSKFEW